jgi:hypothetical protein
VFFEFWWGFFAFLIAFEGFLFYFLLIPAMSFYLFFCLFFLFVFVRLSDFGPFFVSFVSKKVFFEVFFMREMGFFIV